MIIMSKVFKFTLTQLFKNKSNRIVFGILFAVLILAVPVASIFLGDGGAADVGGPAEIYTYADTLESYLENGPDDFDTRYAVQYGYSILIMMICVFSATYIVRAIVEEKSSKLVETLLVSIKSEAMIFGKLLAVMVFMLGMIIAAAAAFALSYMVTGLFTDVSFIGDVLAGLGISRGLLTIGPELTLIILVSMVLAFLLFSQISALSGAGCSTMEDLESANMTGTMVIIAGYLISTITMPIGGKALTIAMTLCPFVSSFSAPVYFVMGDIGWGLMLGSWAIQLALMVLLYKVSGKVYDRLIMYTGRRIKLREILAMAGKGEK